MNRITPGTMIVIIFAILFGLVGAYAARRYFEQKPVVVEKKAPPAVVDPMMTIPMASADLLPGRELRLGDIVLRRVKTSQARKMSLPEEFMGNPQQIIGRTLQVPMKRGEAFQTVNLYPEGTGPTIAERLKSGFRAKTIGVRGTGILTGLATPGTMVDVLFRTTESPGKEIPEATVTLLHGVEVLAVQENTAPGVKNPNTPVPTNVTLAVTPSQANALAIVEGRGEFSLSLRPETEDATPVNPDPQTLEGLLGIKRRPPPPPRAQPQQVETYRGTSRGVLVFDNGNVYDDTVRQPPVNTNPRPVTLPPRLPDGLPPQVENLLNNAN